MRRRRQVAPGVVAVAVLALAAGCASTEEGRTLRPPAPSQTTTTVATDLPADPGPAPLVLSSDVIVEGGDIPAVHTCQGTEVSPPLRWTGVPSGTVELAVVVRDLTAEGLVHWAIAGLPSDTGGLAAGTPPAGAVEATNDLGRPGWAGPCPPSGTHDYLFSLYALAEPSGVTPGQAGSEAASLIETAPVLMSAAISARASAG